MFLTKPTQFFREMRHKRSKLNKIEKEIKFHYCRSAGGLDLDSMRIQTCPTGTISRKGRGGILKVDGGVKFKFRCC